MEDLLRQVSLGSGEGLSASQFIASQVGGVGRGGAGRGGAGGGDG